MNGDITLAAPSQCQRAAKVLTIVCDYGRTLSDASMLYMYFADVFFSSFFIWPP